VNVGLISLATWTPGRDAFRSEEKNKRHLAFGACFLILPVALLSILFGMGAPPDTLEEWVDMATEQKVPFDILLVDGILVAPGLSLIKIVL